ncbi:hypothetical protein DKZ56_12995 [Ureibacillus thermophilus]|uniref:D-alanyl-D-alanine carboxypeptidase/D-alanyl-D-alanine-endopeptidase n=1 Tax=Ureibacillus thermophilus TaxID=367743 RepID=A0A4P6UU36_9BACL|nr:hypothetical protein DKZ56_12995 [Ureibacillus thermophilus]
MLLFLFFISFSCCFAFSHTYAASLDSTIQQKLGSSNVSVSVRSVDNGEIIYQKNGDTPIKPASTLKLLTASAALDVLGSDYRFHTYFYIDGEIKNKTLNGNIYIYGTEDSTFGKNDFQTFAKVLKSKKGKMVCFLDGKSKTIKNSGD